MNENKNEIILFENQNVKLEVNMKEETVWINRQHSLNEELKDIPTVAKFATVQKEGEREVLRNIEYFNLDMILSVGYRVKSKKWCYF